MEKHFPDLLLVLGPVGEIPTAPAVAPSILEEEVKLLVTGQVRETLAAPAVTLSLLGKEEKLSPPSSGKIWHKLYLL